MNTTLIVALALGLAFIGVAETAVAQGPEPMVTCKIVEEPHTVYLPNGDSVTVYEPALVCYY